MSRRDGGGTGSSLEDEDDAPWEPGTLVFWVEGDEEDEQDETMGAEERLRRRQERHRQQKLPPAPLDLTARTLPA